MGAFEELFAAHYPRMVRLAALLGADDPEDVAQKAFVRLERRLGRAEISGSFTRTSATRLASVLKSGTLPTTFAVRQPAAAH